MKILGLGVPELVIILVVVLLIFGPKNLPKLGASLGKTVKSLREGMAFDKKDDEAEEIVEIVEIVEDEPEAAYAAAGEAEVKTVKKVVKKKA
ncbi:twin-arginine translocase TatA/TatE family subunit [Adlercreutzia sp. R25]|uniref:Sec-independent protein translocase protein TatA n=1 Tax=Adlercreutzia shanghongiae TaxID=3111773 RepID=A0ABU6IX13_9ACTN|nr:MULTISPECIES: twin-arginine translocase TatA/TatE family subunit [unclassified Adlercreutzia]MEC4272345.1 twin-arginine translocase TatA/TatE family subunit [Adlercreutzia sp. R25]MEC4294211.1 twin-arginine translocase TatA/TatE family subunit [Adlercreutzia sp. R22]